MGASSSAASASAPRVSFSIPPSADEEDMETASVLGDTSQPSDTSRRLCRLLAQFCPEAFVGLSPAAPKTCQFEGLFSAPVLFHWVAELLSEARQRFEAAAAAGKAPHSFLPAKKRPLASSSDSAFCKASSFNPSLPRFVGNLSGNRSAGVPLHEVGRLEALSQQLLEAQSASFWIFDAILNWLKQEGFQLSDASLFEELVQAFSTCMVGSTASLTSMATFCQDRRREAVLSYYPISTLPEHLHSTILRTPKLPENTHKPMETSFHPPLTLVPLLANYPHSHYSPPSLGVPPSHTPF